MKGMQWKAGCPETGTSGLGRGIGKTNQQQCRYGVPVSISQAWDRLGEQCTEFLHSGSRVRVVGRLTTQSWEDGETGERRQRTVIRASDVLFLDQPGEARGSSGEE
ncbi:MAG: single-stranded DNA-binding protein [Ktedonobacteraceae bacterium]|nr:single-stranded DNA-binding protein [Ktedonobacteraceae bacterium]